MKMTGKRTCKKRGGVLICALAFLLCLTLMAICFGGNPLAAKADGADMRTNLFASSTAVTADTNGVTVASGGTGKINGIFTGDRAFKFSFEKKTKSDFSDLNNDNIQGANFIVTIADAQNASKNFSVVYIGRSDQWNSYTVAYVKYGNTERTASANAWKDSKGYGDDYAYIVVGANFGNFQSGNSATSGKLELAWDKSAVLSVKVQCNEGQRTIAAFDGTDSFANGESWGLPKMEFPNGYTVSFSSAEYVEDAWNEYGGAAVTWKEIAGIALTSEVTTAPKFYTDYKATVVDTKDLFASSTAVTADTNGVKVAKSGTGKINGIFTDDTTLKFSLCEREEGKHGNFRVTITDAENAANTFTVVYHEEAYSTNVYVLYGNTTRTSRAWQVDKSFGWINTKQGIDSYLTTANFLPNGEKTSDGVLSIINDKGVWTVKTKRQASENVIAAFDGTEQLVDGTSWGLPKLDMTAYTVSFAADDWTHPDSTQYSGASVIWKEIAGTALCGDEVTIPQFYKNKDSMPLFSVPAYEANVFAGKEVTVPDVQVKAGLGGTFASATSAKVKTVPSGSDIAADTAISGGKFTPDVPGKYVVEYTGLKNPDPSVSAYNTYEIELTAAARTPVITLSQDIALTALSGSSGTIPSATAVIETTEYSVYVSVMFATESIVERTLASENKTVTFSQVGTYTVEYVTQENSSAVINAQKTYEIIVSQAPPVITLSQEVVSSGVTGRTGIIPAATATIDGAPCDVTVSVIFDNAVLENFVNISAAQERNVAFGKAGTYTVVYYSTANGAETEMTFAITVKDDTAKPVITVGTFESNRVDVGTSITIPTASAVDDADGNVNVTVTVWFGTEEVAVADGKFTANKEGTYRIVFSAADGSGNRAEEEIFIEAVSGDAENADKGCGCKGSLSASSSIGGAVIVLFCAFIITRKNRKQGVK